METAMTFPDWSPFTPFTLYLVLLNLMARSRRLGVHLISSRRAWAPAITRLLETDCSRPWVVVTIEPARASSPTERKKIAPTISTIVNPDSRAVRLFMGSNDPLERGLTFLRVVLQQYACSRRAGPASGLQSACSEGFGRGTAPCFGQPAGKTPSSAATVGRATVGSPIQTFRPYDHDANGGEGRELV